MKKWKDISQKLDERVAVWPGDTAFSYQRNWTKEESGSVNVGQLTMSIHTGTHIDAPFHFDDKGKKTGELDIELYIGKARVIHLPGRNSISARDVSQFNIEGVKRLLIYTGSWKDRSVFPDSIPPIEPDLAVWLADKGVRLLGLDLPSVDPIESKELPAHHALSKNGIHILEGLVLDKVSPGDYELAALPLYLADADGSPVRAVLREL
ncbi:Kynurenine formamidase [Bacillus sp. OV322]|uniref:arylformamidase n=1 Tax=Bacillus sp. OV322 TaxID=1882764 RepID=UPI0008E5A79A|nr:arylformamidase [Bacillus sp. OV322]SFC89004.1 Kynurenine formamidase [Bacillus sp. OV322]